MPNISIVNLNRIFFFTIFLRRVSLTKENQTFLFCQFELFFNDRYVKYRRKLPGLRSFKNDMLYSFAAAIWLWHSYRMTGNQQRIDSLHKKDVKMNKQMSAICVYKHCQQCLDIYYARYVFLLVICCLYDYIEGQTPFSSYWMYGKIVYQPISNKPFHKLMQQVILIENQIAF